ncbi:hypothetical protein PRIPAC_93101 [Pristionchus pacificus]|nr:hypothetical protein PRIPAC_93101 [Pristionchus pacificus]
MWRGCARKPRVKRRRKTTLQSSVDGNDEVLRCVRELKAKEELFSKYLYDDENKGDLPEHVLEYINENLTEIFNCRLQFLQQRCIAIVAVHAFYRSDELYQKWTRCKFPLFTGLLICYILRQMRHVFEDLHEFGLVELYRQSHREFEDYVLEILEVSYRINEGLTRSTLKLTYPDVIKRKNSEKSACSVHYLLDLAMMAKCEQILNHSMCRRITNERWTPDICISRMHFIFAFFTFIPIFFIPFNRQVKRLTKGAIEEQAKRRASQKSQNANRQLMLIGRPASRFSVFGRVFGRIKEAITRNWKNIRVFYSSPCSNFTIHTFFYFLYILLYTSVLLRRRSRIDIRYVSLPYIFSEFWREILLYVWQLSYILDLIYSCLTIGFKNFLASNPADVTHNFFNVVWIFLFLISSVLPEFKFLAWLWGILVVLSKLFFLISFIFSSIRIMRVFAADSFFGAIVVMMKKMVYTLWSFFIVFVLFWCTYAIAIVSLLEKTPTPQTLAWNIFSNGGFEIFGELKDEMKDGEIDECPKMFNSTDIRDFTIDCAFRTWMIPVLLFVYVLVSSVLLVNLVTSFFTNTFEQVQVSSMLHYRNKHYQRLVEFENKISLPAPFSIFYHVLLMFAALLITLNDCIWSDGDDEFIKEIDEKANGQESPESIELLPRNPGIAEKRMVIIMDHDREPRIERVTSGGHSLPLIVDFIQESMKIFRASHEKEQGEPNENRPKPVVNQVKISCKTSTGLYYGCWRKSRTGKMRRSFAKLKFTSRTVPVSIARTNLRSRRHVLSIML